MASDLNRMTALALLALTLGKTEEPGPRGARESSIKSDERQRRNAKRKAARASRKRNR